MPKVFKVGLIGCGHISETYFKAHDYFNNIKIVKCADIIDNSWDIAENDLSFAKVYKSEVFLLLHAMTKVKHTEIWEQAMKSVELMP